VSQAIYVAARLCLSAISPTAADHSRTGRRAADCDQSAQRRLVRALVAVDVPHEQGDARIA
jgi:hypothetical protein